MSRRVKSLVSAAAALAALLAFVLVRLLFRLAEWLRARGGGD